MRFGAFLRLRAPLLAALALSLPTVGCAGSSGATSGPVSPLPEGNVVPTDVSDQAFATSLHRVLRDGGESAERRRLVAGVVRRQLTHAAQRFASGHDADGLDSVIGALYLLRSGEGSKAMVDANGERALAGAIERLASRGDEGRARVLMDMRAAVLPDGSKEKAELQEHRAALEQWMKDTRTGGPLRKLGAEQRAKTARALIDPSPEALEEAAAAIDAWVTQALKLNDDLKSSGRHPEREEMVEAQRAFNAGGPTLAAIYLRRGDAAGALKRLDQSSAREVVQPALHARIRSAAVNDASNARDWLAIATAFASQNPDENDPDTGIDPEVIAGGLWGTALEAWRREPTNFDAAFLVARSLQRFGMPEAAPLVMTEAVKAKPTPNSVSAALTMLLESVSWSTRNDDLETARRTFQVAGPLLTLADQRDLAGKLDPSPARVRAVMAAVEVRAGNLDAARTLLRASVAAEPSVSGYTTLALVERQAGDPKAALAAVESALRAPGANTELFDVAEANLLSFELHRDGIAPGGTKAPLEAALKAVLAARQLSGPAPQKARAEQLLGRVLEAYGDGKAADRAYERAMTLASTERPLLGAIMLDAIGRALVRRDLPAARAALARGIEADVSPDDLVYGGLWVSLLERDLKEKPDGSAERALRTAGKTGWTAKLSAWANGKLDDAALGAAAQSASQKVEAAFYTAMSRKVAGDPAADQRLRQVATAPVIDLLEVQIARELLAPRARTELPVGVKLP